MMVCRIFIKATVKQYEKIETENMNIKDIK